MKTTTSDNGVTVVKEAIENKNCDFLQTVFDAKKMSYVTLVTMIYESGLSVTDKSEMMYYFSPDFEKSVKAVEIAELAYRDEAEEIFKSIDKKSLISAIYKNYGCGWFKFDYPEIPSRCKEAFNSIKNSYISKINDKISKIRKNLKVEVIDNRRNFVSSGWGGQKYNPVDFNIRKRYDFLSNYYEKAVKKNPYSMPHSIVNFLKKENWKETAELINTYSNREFKELIDSIQIAYNEKQNKIAIENQQKNDFTEKTGLHSSYLNCEKTLANWLNGNSRPAGYVFFNEFYIVALETEQTDWSAYSKAWHRAHGPKRWTEERRLELHRAGQPVEKISIGERWSNNAIFEALSKRFNIQKSECKGRQQVQLNEFFDVELIKSLNGYEIYKRCFAGELIDFAIFDTKQKVTYHDSDKNNLVKGLKTKIQAKAEKEREILNKQFAFDLGFCETGTRQFCELNGLDFEGEYTRQEVRNAILKNRLENCKKFGWEIRKAGFNINCK